MTGAELIAAEQHKLVREPSCYGPGGCEVCMWGRAEVVVIRTTLCLACARSIAAEIDRLQRQEKTP